MPPFLFTIKQVILKRNSSLTMLVQSHILLVSQWNTSEISLSSSFKQHFIMTSPKNYKNTIKASTCKCHLNLYLQPEAIQQLFFTVWGFLFFLRIFQSTFFFLTGHEQTVASIQMQTIDINDVKVPYFFFFFFESGYKYSVNNTDATFSFSFNQDVSSGKISSE